MCTQVNEIIYKIGKEVTIEIKGNLHIFFHDDEAIAFENICGQIIIFD